MLSWGEDLIPLYRVSPKAVGAWDKQLGCWKAQHSRQEVCMGMSARREAMEEELESLSLRSEVQTSWQELGKRTATSIREELGFQERNSATSFKLGPLGEDSFSEKVASSCGGLCHHSQLSSPFPGQVSIPTSGNSFLPHNGYLLIEWEEQGQSARYTQSFPSPSSIALPTRRRLLQPGSWIPGDL